MSDTKPQVQAIFDRHNEQSKTVYYRLMQPSDGPQIAELGSATYCRSEPCTKCVIAENPGKLQQLQQEQKWWFNHQTEEQAKHRTSVVAVVRNGTSEHIVAFSQAFPQPPPDDHVPDLVITPVIHLTRKLQESWKSPENTLLLQDLAVSDQYSGHGIATQLVQITVELAQLFQYQHMVAQCSSASQNVFLKAGFESINHIVYDEYEKDGERPFAGIQPFSKHFPTPAVRQMYRKL